MAAAARQADTTANRAEALDFVLRNLAVLAPRLGQEELARLPGLFKAGCSSDEARRLDAGFRSAMAQVAGGRGALTRTVEAVQLCTAWRARQTGTLE